jgi:hypothetical protein
LDRGPKDAKAHRKGHVSINKKAAISILKPRRETSGETKPACTLMSRTARNKFSVV